VSARVLLTGAAGGIGTATAAELRERGARVVGLDVMQDRDIIACDVRDQAAVDRAVAEAIGRLGGLDALINNVPVERVEDAARTLARAALGPPARDLATTRHGAIGYALLRHIPRRALDAIVRRRLARIRLPAS